MKNISYNGPGSVYCDAVIADDRLYLSGLIAEDWETGKVVNGTIEEETELVMKNMKTMLERYGSGMDKVIRVQIILSDFTERDRMNAVYVTKFPEGKLPSRFCYGVNGIACGCKVEMMVDAYI